MVLMVFNLFENKNVLSVIMFGRMVHLSSSTSNWVAFRKVARANRLCSTLPTEIRRLCPQTLKEYPECLYSSLQVSGLPFGHNCVLSIEDLRHYLLTSVLLVTSFTIVPQFTLSVHQTCDSTHLCNGWVHLCAQGSWPVCLLVLPLARFSSVGGSSSMWPRGRCETHLRMSRHPQRHEVHLLLFLGTDVSVTSSSHSLTFSSSFALDSFMSCKFSAAEVHNFAMADLTMPSLQPPDLPIILLLNVLVESRRQKKS